MQKYVFRPYDSKYPKYFEREKKMLQQILGAETKIEHVGSSSVSGLGGKGFIDMVIAIPTKADLAVYKEKMLAKGYHFELDASTEERYYFDREFTDDNGDDSMYHYHLTYVDSQDWKALIAFRDLLRTNAEARAEYAEVKRMAAESANQDRKIYVKIKNPVIERLLKQALSAKL